MATAYKPGKADDKLSKLVGWVNDAEDASRAGRDNSLRYRRYYDNDQLTAEELAALAKRGQPKVIINRIKRKVEYNVGVEMQQRSDPRGLPRTPNEEQSAEAVTDALRFVADASRFDVIRSRVWENMLIEGFGGCEVLVAMKKNRDGKEQAEVELKHWHWDRLGYDPHSREPDFSDAKYLYTVTWMDEEDATEEWPDAKDAISASYTGESADEATEDRPRDMMWADPKRKRIKIIGMYYVEGSKWHQCVFTKGGPLESKPVPFVNGDGESQCPLVLASAYVDLDNDRYGIVRDMIGPQDELNKRRSKALHLFTMRQTAGEQGAVEDVRKMKQELAKPDGHVQYTPGMKFEVLPTADLAAGHFQLMEHAMAELDLMGPNAAMAGKDPRDQSGRAILAQQAGGQVELLPLMDQLKQWSLRVYRQIWDRIRQYWTEERWVRVTDNEQNVRFVGLNRQLTQSEAMARQLEKQGMAPEQIMAQLQQAAQRFGPDALEQPSGEMDNAVADLDVDIIVSETPDTPSIQIEQFQQIAEMVKAGLPIPPDVVIQASQLRNKEEIIERLKGGGEPNPQQQQAMALQMQELQAKVAALMAKADLDTAKAEEARANIGRPDGQPEPVDPLDRMKTAAEIEHTQAQTRKVAADTFATIKGTQEPPPDPLDGDVKRAQIEKTKADAFATRKNALRPKTKAA